MLTKLGLLFLSDQYVKIEVEKGSKGSKEIKTNLRDQKEKDNKSIAMKATLIYPYASFNTILLKDNNQVLITIAYNPVYHIPINHLNIKYYYIYDKIAFEQINLKYILTNKKIMNGLTKVLIYAKFHTFII